MRAVTVDWAANGELKQNEFSLPWWCFSIKDSTVINNWLQSLVFKKRFKISGLDPLGFPGVVRSWVNMPHWLIDPYHPLNPAPLPPEESYKGRTLLSMERRKRGLPISRNSVYRMDSTAARNDTENKSLTANRKVNESRQQPAYCDCFSCFSWQKVVNMPNMSHF